MRFSGSDDDGMLVGIMGAQPINDVTLIRHAYNATWHRNKGLGSALLTCFLKQTKWPVLVGMARSRCPWRGDYQGRCAPTTSTPTWWNGRLAGPQPKGQHRLREA